MISDDPLLAKEGVVEVKSLGASVMPELVKQFPKATPETRMKMVDVAVEIHNPEELTVALFRLASEDSIAAVRRHAAAKASKLPQFAASLKPLLLASLQDAVPEVSAAALTTLGGLPGPQEPPSQQLMQLLNDKHIIVAATASNVALQRREPYLQAAARAALPRLIGALHDNAPATRAAVLFAIGQFGIAASPAVTPVKAVLTTDPVPEVRLQAALTLHRIGTPAAREAAQGALTAFSHDKNPIIKRAAEAALVDS
jgi:HEAT repeat protein